MKRFLLLLLFLLFPLLTAGTWFVSQPEGLRGWTGVEDRPSQIRGIGHLVSGRLRPYPAGAPLRPVRHAGLYPFGINTFLQQETEPEKVERSLDMIAEGGFRWIRQEFVWEDLEIHHNDWYVDLRNDAIRNAWDKYDRIVTLAEARDIEIIARLSNPPSWSRQAGDERGAKAPPDALEHYGDYVEAVVSRYKGQVRYFQIWNEPNCCHEWGHFTVSPEQYVEMLKVAYTRAKAANPDAVIMTAPLAPTIETVSQTGGTPAPALNDFLFLQRMYDAGAQDYFDVLAVQAYGLWSGPLDRRMRPRVVNYSRPEYIRDIMVRNGDRDKAIWISEMGWNSTPPDRGIYPSFGYHPEKRRGRYLVEALERQRREWPWAGVTTVWFFKQESDERKDQATYYFRLVAPDFEPLPAWEDFTAYINDVEPVLYRGYHQENHWALRHDLSGDGAWSLQTEEGAVFEQVALGTGGDRIRFGVEGDRLTLVLHSGHVGDLRVKIGDEEQRFRLDGTAIARASGEVLQSRNPLDGDPAYDRDPLFYLSLGDLPPGRTDVELSVENGQVLLDGVVVE